MVIYLLAMTLSPYRDKQDTQRKRKPRDNANGTCSEKEIETVRSRERVSERERGGEEGGGDSRFLRRAVNVVAASCCHEGNPRVLSRAPKSNL